MAGFGRSAASKASWAVKRVEKQKEYDILIEKIRQAGNLKKTAQIHLNPRPIDLDSLLFDDKHINAERAHNVTQAQAKQWILEAKISVTVWNGQFERYYGENGAVYVDIKSHSIRTAYSQDEYDENMRTLMEVIKENGL